MNGFGLCTIWAMQLSEASVDNTLLNLHNSWDGPCSSYLEEKSPIVHFPDPKKYRGVARGVLGCPPPLCRPSFEQTTYNIQLAKTPWQYLGRKRHHCWKALFFKICFFEKYFRQRLFSLVDMGLRAMIIRLSPLIHEGEQRYKPNIVGNPRMVSLLWPPLWKILATPLKY